MDYLSIDAINHTITEDNWIIFRLLFEKDARIYCIAIRNNIMKC